MRTTITVNPQLPTVEVRPQGFRVTVMTGLRGPKGETGPVSTVPGPIGPAGPGLPEGTSVQRVGQYLQWEIDGQTYHTRLLAGPAPTSP